MTMTGMKKASRPSLTLILAVCVGLLTACGPKSVDELVASASEYAEKGDHAAAVIQLKNALQQTPEHGKARLMLGEALLATRDYVGAEKELRRALELKQPEEVVLPSLLRSLAEAGRYEVIVKEFGDRDLKQGQAPFKSLVGDAALARGDPAMAAAAYAAALEADSKFPPALLGVAMVRFSNGELDEAEKAVNLLLSAHPKMARAHTLKSDVRQARGDMQGSRDALQKAVAADPQYIPARFALVGVLIDARAYDDAQQQIQEVRKLVPRDVRIDYYAGLLAFRQGKVEAAQQHIQQVVKFLPSHVPSLVLAGAIDLQGGSLVTAESHLSKAIAQVPAHTEARKLLVQTYLRMGQPGRAKDVIEPLMDRPGQADSKLLLLAGETYLANGDARAAANFYQAAAKAGESSQQAQARTRLGQIALATGRTDEGLKELEAASDLDAGRYQADLATIAAHLRSGKADAAMAAVKKLEAKQPKNPLTFHMYGLVNLAKRDLAGARASFAKAVELQPTYLPAAVNLALLDLADRKPDEAKKRIEAIVEKDPKNERAYLALADILNRSGADAKDVIAVVKRGVAANPQSAEARLALVSQHLRANDSKSALVAAQEALAVAPSDARVLSALATAQEAAGESNQAIQTLNKLVAMNPKQPGPHVRLAGLFARQKETDKSIEALRQAQKLGANPRELAPVVARVYIAANRFEDALKEVRELKRKDPKYAGVYALEADILVTQRKLVEAEALYREALKHEPDANSIAIRLHTVLQAQKKDAEADALAKRWTSANPNDTAMLIYLGDRELKEKNFKAAAGHYRAVIGVQPNHAVALNNLAWIGGEIGDPKALEYAERAVKVAPNNAAILDTYGTLLVKQGQADKGLEVMTRARKLAPDRNDVRLNYAKALLKAGRKDEARKELEVLKSASQEFMGKDQIDGLLKSL